MNYIMTSILRGIIRMKYCVQCRKVDSALGLAGLTLCIASGHELVEITFQELMQSAERLGTLSAKGYKLGGVCQCHWKTTNCCGECKK
jgi:hypothetical protein